MKTGVMAFTDKGLALGERIKDFLASEGHETELVRVAGAEMKSWVRAHFESDDAIIFIGATGIAVRLIAPFVKSKLTDPAVITLDELGTFSISLLSGHIGGANELSGLIAHHIGAIHVVTTATDINGVFAVDTWAKKQGLKIANPERIKWISSRLLAGENITVKSNFPVEGNLPDKLSLDDEAGDILISYRTRGRKESLRLVPPVITLGLGCRKGVGADAIEAAYEAMLKKANCHPAAIKQVCSIDLKAAEPGIIEFCRNHGLPYKTFSADQLNSLQGNFSGSQFVKKVTGVDNVCERSAVYGAGPEGRILTDKDAGNGITMALAIEPFTVKF